MGNQMENVVTGIVTASFIDKTYGKDGKEFSKRIINILPDEMDRNFQFAISWKIKDGPEIKVGEKIAAKWSLAQFGNSEKKFTTAEITEYEILSGIMQENVPATTPEQTYPSGNSMPTPKSLPTNGVQESDFDFSK